MPGVETVPSEERDKIREEDLKENRPAPRPGRASPSGPPAATRGAPPAPPDDSSLIAMITPQTPPRRAAALRLTEEGRRLIRSGDYAKALDRLEKTISIDSTNPYGYYYLAKTHFYLGRYQESLNFLDVAESRFGGDSHWLAEVFALRGENYRALGFPQKADASYSQALRLDPDNRVAAEGLNIVRGEIQPPSR